MKRASLRGQMAVQCIRGFTATPRGRTYATGMGHQNPKEYRWKCPKGYTNEKLAHENFQMEFLSPDQDKNDLAVLQLHGGGYIGTLRNAYRRAALQYSICSGGGSVLSPDYRVVPEHPFPAALKDAVSAYRWLTEEKGFPPEKIVIAGDSAGGGLALALGLYLKDHGISMPAGFILMSPWTDLTLSGESLKYNYGRDPLFGRSKVTMLYDSLYPGSEDVSNPYISPLFGDYHGFPPMLFQVGGRDVLLDDTLRVARKVKESGVSVRNSVYPDMFHVFQLAMGMLPESKEAWREIRTFFRMIFGTKKRH